MLTYIYSCYHLLVNVLYLQVENMFFFGRANSTYIDYLLNVLLNRRPFTTLQCTCMWGSVKYFIHILINETNLFLS